MEFKINKVPINSVRTADNPAESLPKIYLSNYLISNLDKLGKFQQTHLLSNASYYKYIHSVFQYEGLSNLTIKTDGSAISQDWPKISKMPSKASVQTW